MFLTIFNSLCFHKRRGALFLALPLALCLAGAPCPASASLALPPPVDRVLDVLLGYPPNIAPGNALDAPTRPQTIRAQAKTPQSIMPVFLGIPYREDGVINDDGQYATFTEPVNILATPGLNCSGLVLSAARIVLEQNITVAEAVRDRHNDSGPDAADGKDWDFGFDLIMNLSDDWPRALLAPRRLADTKNATGKNVPVFDMHAASFTADFLPHIQKNGFYLVSFSRHATPQSPPRQHYHTGIVVREDDTVWLYSTTRHSGKVIRHNLSSSEGLAGFRKSFADTPNSYKRMTVIAVHGSPSADLLP